MQSAIQFLGTQGAAERRFRGLRDKMQFNSFGALLDAIVTAIIREEGRPADDTNPGDLRAAPWLPKSDVIFKPLTVGQFWNPATRAEGIAGAYHVVALHVAELQNLQTLIYIWAPPSENNSAKYLSNVMEWAGISDASVPLYQLVNF